MVEVLYDFKRDEIYLFEGQFDLDQYNKCINAVLKAREDIKFQELPKLEDTVHIGWL